MENQLNIFSEGPKQTLTNATAVLVLGIISIVTCCCYGVVGLICGIIALVLANKDLALYKVDPGRYTESSFKNLNAGRICAIVGICLSAIYVVLVIIGLSSGRYQSIMDQYLHR